MKERKVEGTIDKAFGQALDETLTYSSTYQEFVTIDEVKAAGSFPSDKDIVGYVNVDLRNNERAKAMKAALDAANVKPPDPNSEEQIRKNLISANLKAGLPQEIAERVADAALKQAALIKAGAAVTA